VRVGLPLGGRVAVGPGPSALLRHGIPLVSAKRSTELKIQNQMDLLTPFSNQGALRVSSSG
ncbi:hypothetical protein, partial [Actinomadura luteofluorescens]